MADPVVLSVIFSGAVGLAGVAVGAYGHHATVRSETGKRLEARRDDLRAVLDEAAGLALEFQRQVLDPRQTFGVSAVEVQRSLGPMLRAHARIGVRVGPQKPSYRSYNTVIEAVHHLGLVLERLPADETLAELDRKRHGDNALATLYQRAEDAVDRVNNAVERFLSASFTLVGVVGNARAGPSAER